MTDHFGGEALSLLARQLPRSVTVIDVGCRWGPSNIWASLEPHFKLIGFDPDPEECASLNSRHGVAGKIRFVPLALGDSQATALLHLTEEPACASFYEPDLGLIADRPALSVTRPAGRSQVEVTTLDDWIAEDGLESVDFIKVDTQGSELAVLEGAKRTLKSVRAVEVEVEFNPIYKNQPLFGDVDRFLRSRGFVLWRLCNLVHYGLPGSLSNFKSEETHFYDDGPVEFQGGGGQLFWANAFYVARDFAFPEPGSQSLSSVVDASIAGALGFWDLFRLRLRSWDSPAKSRVLEAFESSHGKV